MYLCKNLKYRVRSRELFRVVEKSWSWLKKFEYLEFVSYLKIKRPWMALNSRILRVLEHFRATSPCGTILIILNRGGAGKSLKKVVFLPENYNNFILHFAIFSPFFEHFQKCVFLSNMVVFLSDCWRMYKNYFKVIVLTDDDRPTPKQNQFFLSHLIKTNTISLRREC